MKKAQNRYLLYKTIDVSILYQFGSVSDSGLSFLLLLCTPKMCLKCTFFLYWFSQYFHSSALESVAQDFAVTDLKKELKNSQLVAMETLDESLFKETE